MPPNERHTSELDAIVLRKTNYGEADVVVTLLTAERGKLSALARSARKSTRRFAGGLGVGLQGKARLKGQGEGTYFLEAFEVIQNRIGLGTTLAKLAHTAYALELCERLCPIEQPERSVYGWLESFLDLLECQSPSSSRLRIFELGLLGRLGLAPLFSRCSGCGGEEFAGGVVRFVPRIGAVYCSTCSSGGEQLANDDRIALVALQVASLQSTIQLEPAMNLSLRRVILAILQGYVQGPLRSLEFMEKMSAHLSSSR